MAIKIKSQLQRDIKKLEKLQEQLRQLQVKEDDLRREISLVSNRVKEATFQKKAKLDHNGRWIDCSNRDCQFKGECANHDSASQFRTEDGSTPNLILIDGEVFCDMTVIRDYGALLVNRNNEFVKK